MYAEKLIVPLYTLPHGYNFIDIITNTLFFSPLVNTWLECAFKPRVFMCQGAILMTRQGFSMKKNKE